MPPMKRRSKKVVRKVAPKKTFKKKQPVAAATAAMASVSIHHNKLLSTLFDKVHYEVKLAREFEASAIPALGVSAGLIPLQYNTAFTAGNHTALPMHLYDMTQLTSNVPSLATGSTLGGQVYIDRISNNLFVSQLGFTNTTQASISRVSAEDGSSMATNTAYNRTMMEYYQLRLDLYQRDLYSTEYNVMILKVNDETLSIESGQYTSPSQQAFWKNLARPYYTNTIVPEDHRIKNDLKGRFTILWEKTYKLKEKLDDADSLTFKRVNIFKRINKVLKYNENMAQPDMSTDNPSTIGTTTATIGATTNQTRIKDRIYVVVRANSTNDQNNTVSGNDTGAVLGINTPSYNLYWRSKHVIPQS